MSPRGHDRRRRGQHYLGIRRRCSTSRSITPTVRWPPCTARARMCPSKSWPAPSRRTSTTIPLPKRPIVSWVQTPHDRIAIEIMRGCPWQCRFCQSTVIKRPLRVRSVETIVEAALESYRNTGYDEISLLSLSTSDYPDFEELVTRMHQVFTPLGVNVSLPSLRVNSHLLSVPRLMKDARKSGLTLAPEVARDDMREQIRKPIKNDDLYDACREAFANGWQKVKLYFLCGLPGERMVDLDGIVDMAQRIARISKEATGRYKEVTASVSNFVPKPHTPYQWNGMQTREYLRWAGDYMRKRIQHALGENQAARCGMQLARRHPDARRPARGRGAGGGVAARRRMDGWRECFQPDLWWQTFADLGIDTAFYSQRARPTDERLPWDHVNVKKGREYLEKEQNRSLLQLQVMAEAR